MGMEHVHMISYVSFVEIFTVYILLLYVVFIFQLVYQHSCHDVKMLFPNMFTITVTLRPPTQTTTATATAMFF